MSWYEGDKDEAASPKAVKEYSVLKRLSPTGEPQEATIIVWVSEELVKLEEQLKNEKFLSKAPAAAIEKVKKRLEKLLLEMPAIPKYINRKLDEATPGGYYWSITGREIWCGYLDENGKRGGASSGYIFDTRQQAEDAWAEVNEFWMTPHPWAVAAKERQRREEKAERRKQYLKLKEEFDAEFDSPATYALV